MRRLSTFLMILVIVSGLAASCKPRHPPHTPQPVPDLPAPNRQS